MDEIRYFKTAIVTVIFSGIGGFIYGYTDVKEKVLEKNTSEYSQTVRAEMDKTFNRLVAQKQHLDNMSNQLDIAYSNGQAEVINRLIKDVETNRAAFENLREGFIYRGFTDRAFGETDFVHYAKKVKGAGLSRYISKTNTSAPTSVYFVKQSKGVQRTLSFDTADAAGLDECRKRFSQLTPTFADAYKVERCVNHNPPRFVQGGLMSLAWLMPSPFVTLLLYLGIPLIRNSASKIHSKTFGKPKRWGN